MRKMIVCGLAALCLGLAVAPKADAQRRMRQHKMFYNDPYYVEPSGWGLGVNIGLSDLWGDVGTKSILDHYTNSKYWSKPHFMGGLFGRYTIHPSLGLRFGINYGTLYANDNWNETKAKKELFSEADPVQRYFRNQNAKTNIWEGSLLLEINPLRLGNLELRSKVFRRFQPYLLAGIGYYHFEPMSQLENGRWIKTYDLNLEGNGYVDANKQPLANTPATYSKWQLNVPLGIGVRWDIGHQLDLGIEYQYRYCFTDYLDGVSANYINPDYYDINLSPRDAAAAKQLADKSYLIQADMKHAAGELRGNSAVNDGYSTISISLFYKVKAKKIPWWWKYE